MVTKLGGTVDDSELVPGAVFDHKAAKTAGGPTRVENAKIALVQFHISPPKTDLENNVIISDYAQAGPRRPPPHGMGRVPPSRISRQGLDASRMSTLIQQYRGRGCSSLACPEYER